MFREMRRKAQQIPDAEAEEILKNGKTGVLAVLGDDGYPYAVPVNYAYENGRICFHSAMVGHKIEAIRKNPKVSFTVIDRDEVLAKERTTAYRSVICFGEASEIGDKEEKIRALRLFGYKYSGAYRELVDQEIEEALDATSCVEIRIQHMTGKIGSALLQH